MKFQSSKPTKGRKPPWPERRAEKTSERSRKQYKPLWGEAATSGGRGQSPLGQSAEQKKPVNAAENSTNRLGVKPRPAAGGGKAPLARAPSGKNGGDGNRTRVLETSQYILYMFRTLILSPEWLQRTQPSLAS